MDEAHKIDDPELAEAHRMTSKTYANNQEVRFPLWYGLYFSGRENLPGVCPLSLWQSYFDFSISMMLYPICCVSGRENLPGVCPLVLCCLFPLLEFLIDLTLLGSSNCWEQQRRIHCLYCEHTKPGKDQNPPWRYQRKPQGTIYRVSSRLWFPWPFMWIVRATNGP